MELYIHKFFASRVEQFLSWLIDEFMKFLKTFFFCTTFSVKHWKLEHFSLPQSRRLFLYSKNECSDELLYSQFLIINFGRSMFIVTFFTFSRWKNIARWSLIICYVVILTNFDASFDAKRNMIQNCRWVLRIRWVWIAVWKLRIPPSIER